jgi:hypothetical protein
MKKVTGIGGIFFKCKNQYKIEHWEPDDFDYNKIVEGRTK